MPEALSSTLPTFTAPDVIDKIVSSKEFATNTREGLSIEQSLSRTALELAGMSHDIPLEESFELDTKNATTEQSLYALVGLMPEYVRGIEGLRHHHTVEQLPRDVYTSLKARTARFNHAVKSLIVGDPTLDFPQVSTMVTTLYGVVNRDRWGDDRSDYEREATWFRKQFEGVLRGMQQEVISLQIIDMINEIKPVVNKATGEYKPRVVANPHVSAEDDLHGADLYITLDGVMFPIDIKASERTADNSRRKSRYPASIMTTGISSHELCGKMTLDEWRVRKAAPAFLAKLYAARAEFLAKHASVQAA